MLASQQPCCMLRGMSVSRAPHAISRLVVVQAASNQPSSSGRHGTEPSLPKPSRPARSSGQAAAGSSSQLTKDGQPQTKQAPSGTALAMDPVENARRKMGYKNNWHRREVDDSKQFTWGKPLKQDPTVAIIGGGLSGLMCATGLARKGIRSVVFDTGQHDVGGRIATRSSLDSSLKRKAGSGSGAAAVAGQGQAPPAGARFDHAAQFFTATDPLFQAEVAGWMSQGLVKEWQGPVGSLNAKDGRFSQLPAAPARLVAPGGMRALAAGLAARLSKEHAGMVEIRRPCWVGKMQAEAGLGWKLSGEGRQQGVFDAVVIAHNGKCANRLVGPTGAPKVASQLMGLRLSAIWAVMVAFEGDVGAPFEGAFVQGSDVLTWAGNNTAKMGLRHNVPGLQCWTLFSTNAFGQANKVPQENIPAAVEAKVTQEMVDALHRALAPSRGSQPLPKVVFSRAQLWGAALPTNTPGVRCILDPASRVGVCGDWLSGSSMQAAALSGLDLADRLAGLRGVDPQVPGALLPHCIGLTESFSPVRGTEIGQFPH